MMNFYIDLKSIEVDVIKEFRVVLCQIRLPFKILEQKVLSHFLIPEFNLQIPEDDFQLLAIQMTNSYPVFSTADLRESDANIFFQRNSGRNRYHFKSAEIKNSTDFPNQIFIIIDVGFCDWSNLCWYLSHTKKLQIFSFSYCQFFSSSLSACNENLCITFSFLRWYFQTQKTSIFQFFTPNAKHSFRLFSPFAFLKMWP